MRWGGILSFWRRITAGVRQAGILSRVLFAIYMDTLTQILRSPGLGCKLVDKYCGCLVCADDILLSSQTANAMRVMLEICDEFAIDSDLQLNCSKSVAVRIGTVYSVQSPPLFSVEASLSLSVK